MLQIAGSKPGQGLMAPSQEEEVIGGKHLIGEDGDNTLDRLAIVSGIIPKQQIIHKLGVPTPIEYVRQLLIIPHGPRGDMNGPINPQEGGLCQDQGFDFPAQLDKLF